VTIKCERFLYHENWLIGSIEEVRGHTDNMEMKRKAQCRVTFKCERFLYHENWLTGSTEEVRGQTDSMEIKRKAQCRGDLQMVEILIS